ncbi:MAG TPA: hypothetical protein VK181_02265 [Rhizobium sp.]|nr:hypothetical protein [Rhizobium sp.]
MEDQKSRTLARQGCDKRVRREMGDIELSWLVVKDDMGSVQ